MKILFRQELAKDMPIEEDFSSPSLTEDIEKTRYALEIAYAGFDNAIEPDMIDCYIYEIVPESSPKSPVRALLSHVFG